MDIFVDLQGASGATYRFRAWPQTGQSPIAGNFAVVETGARGLKVRMVGVTNDLSRAESHAQAAGLGSGRLFVRLNVARATRHLEHEDIVAQYGPPEVFQGDD